MNYFKLLIGLFCLPIAAQAQPKPQWADGILTIVGDKIIMRNEVETEFANQLSQKEADSSLTKCAILNNLILQKLLINQAELDSLPLSEEQTESELENRMRYFQRQIGTREALEAYLGMSLAEYKNQIRPKMREQLLAQQMQSKITGDANISPSQVKAYFDSIPIQNLPLIPASAKVGQLIVEPPFSDFAKEYTIEMLSDLRKRIVNGESFERLAKLYSQDPGSKIENGLLPEFGRGDMVSVFEKQAFKLQPDSLSPVFQSEFGFHLIKLVNRKGDRVNARHILLRPEFTSIDLEKSTAFMDSIYNELVNKNAKWCEIVRKHNKSKFNNPDYCGFLQDEVTGSEKVFYETLPTETRTIVDQLKPGEYSKPFSSKLPTGSTVYYIVYFKELIPPHTANLIDDYDRIKLQAAEALKSQKLNTWVLQTKTNTYVKINSEFMDCPNLTKWQ